MGIRPQVEFLNTWSGELKNGVLRVRYEDMHSDIEKVVRKVLGHVGMEFEDEKMRRAIERASFENIRKAESRAYNMKIRINNQDVGVMKGGIPQDARKYRKGKMGEYKKELKPETIDYINNCISEHLDPAYEDYINV